MVTAAPSSTPWTTGSDGPGVLELRDYIQILQRRKLPVVLCGVGFFLASLVFALRVPNFYRSETRIQVDPQQVPSNYVQSTVSTSIQDRLSTIQDQVLSTTQLQRIIDRLGLYPELRGKRSDQEIIKIMQKAITVDAASSGEHRLSAFSIGFQSRDPKTASKVANELAAQFIDENLRVRLEQFNGAAEFLDSELRETREQLESKEHELQRIRSQNILDLPESRQYHLETLNNLRNQLRSVQDRISRAQGQKVLLQSYAPTVDLDTGVGAAGMSPAQAKVQRVEGELAQLRSRYGPGHPDVRKMEAQLAELKQEAAEEQKEQAAMGTQTPVIASAGPAPTKNPVLVAEEQNLNAEIEEQSKIEKQLNDQINFHTSKLEQGPVFEQQIASLMRDYDNLRGHYSSLLDKKLSAEMARELEGRQQGERFVVLDPAPVPLGPAGPNRLMISIGGLVLGTLAGMGVSIVMGFLDESVRTEREAATLLGKPVLAGVPQVFGEEEQRSRRLRLTGALVGTAACAVAVGYALSMFGSSL